jgi:hypothetical protein
LVRGGLTKTSHPPNKKKEESTKHKLTKVTKLCLCVPFGKTQIDEGDEAVLCAEDDQPYLRQKKGGEVGRGIDKA